MAILICTFNQTVLETPITKKTKDEEANDTKHLEVKYRTLTLVNFIPSTLSYWDIDKRYIQ